MRQKARYNACMNMTVKITKIGNSAGVILPKELLAHLHAATGDTLGATQQLCELGFYLGLCFGLGAGQQ